MSLNTNIKLKKNDYSIELEDSRVESVFEINGQKYNSWDDVPDNYKKMINEAKKTGNVTVLSDKRQVEIDGIKYNSRASIPDEKRYLWDKIAKMGESRKGYSVNSKIYVKWDWKIYWFFSILISLLLLYILTNPTGRQMILELFN